MIVMRGAPVGGVAQGPKVEQYLRLPLAFEHLGKGTGERFVAHGQGYAVVLSNGRATLAVQPRQPENTAVRPQGVSISMELSGARQVVPTPGRELPGQVNYIRGNDPRRWQLGLPTYERVSYREVYPGVDVVYYGNQKQLEFDLVLKPGASPEQVRLKFGGAQKISVGPSGELSLATAIGDLNIGVPAVYQVSGGARKQIRAGYKLLANGEVAFTVGAYDSRKTLVIDPTIVYSTLLGGGTSDTNPQSIAIDGIGNAYVAGFTDATDFPTVNALQAALRGAPDGFVSKMNSTGTALLYSTYIGGSSSDQFFGIAVDTTGAAWVTGQTSSVDFPVLGAYQGTLRSGANAVVVKLNPNGSLAYSTYLGNTAFSTSGNAIAVDPSNNAYVTGLTTDNSFGTTSGVVQPTDTNSQNKAFVTKFSSAGAVAYSTFLGGDQVDYGFGIAADSSGNAYVTGQSFDNSFTNAPGGGARTTNAGNGDAFVAKLNPTGTAILYFTFLGGSAADQGNAIALDNANPPNAYVGGFTFSSNLSATGGVVQTTYGGGGDGFVAKLNGTGTTFTFVTYLGGSRNDFVQSLAVDSGGVYVTGGTDSNTFPTSAPFLGAIPGNSTSLFETTNGGTSWSIFDSNIPGAVNDIAPNPTNASIFVATTESGIFRTVNGGTTWTLQSSTVLSSLSRSPANANIIYGGFGTTSYNSTDDGLTWNFRGFTGTRLQRIVADPLTASTVYLFSANSGVYKSTDSGGTWNSANSGLPSPIVRAMAAAPDGSLYVAVAAQGIYKSTSQAGTWTPVNTGLPSGFTGTALAASNNALDLYASNGTVYKTTNGGLGWTATGANIPDANAGYLAVSPTNPLIVYAASPDVPTVYSTTDGGNTWTPIGSGLGAATPTEIVVDPANTSLIFAVTPVHASGFVSKINTSGTAFLYSSYLSGTGPTAPRGIAADGLGNAFVTGNTTGGVFPTTASAFQTSGPNVPEGFIVKISDATSSCPPTFQVSPSGNKLIYGAEQTLNFFVTAPTGCPWTANSSQSWATFPNGFSGSGSGIVSVQAASNGTGSTRNTILTIGNQTIMLSQTSVSCTYTLDNYTPTVSPNGGNVLITVFAGPGCTWSVVNNYPSAITVTTGSGSGNGGLGLTVGQNVSTSIARSFTIPVGTTSFTISQAASPISGGAKYHDWAGTGRSGALLYVPSSGAEATVLRNGDGTYTYVGNLFTAGFDTLRSGDFNGDGKADMVVYNSTNALAYIGFSNGDGTFNFQSLFWSPGYNYVEPGDLNGDGKTDFALYNSSTGTMYTGISNTLGQFTYKYTLISMGYTYLKLADFNGDGKADLFAYNVVSGNTTVGIGDGLGGFTFHSFQISPNYNLIDVGDLNADGKADVLLYNATNGNAATGISDGLGGFAFTSMLFTPNFTHIRLAEFTGHTGKADAVLYNTNNALAFFGTGTGTGAFNFVSLFWSPHYTSVEPEDVNNDGKTDIILYNVADGTEYTGISNGDGTFTYTYSYWGYPRVLGR